MENSCESVGEFGCVLNAQCFFLFEIKDFPQRYNYY